MVLICKSRGLTRNPHSAHSESLSTYPTTYIAYTSASRLYIPSQAITTTCAVTSSGLSWPTPTPWAELVYPISETAGPDLPPTALIDYLNQQPQFLAQIGGQPIGSSCDPIVGAVANPTTIDAGAAVLYTSAHVLAATPGVTQTTSIGVELASAVASPSTTLAAPVMQSTSAAATSFSAVMQSVAAAHRNIDVNFIKVETWVLGAFGAGLAML